MTRSDGRDFDECEFCGVRNCRVHEGWWVKIARGYVGPRMRISSDAELQEAVRLLRSYEQQLEKGIVSLGVNPEELRREIERYLRQPVEAA